MIEYLYHGSHAVLLAGMYLKPHISFDYEPLVYATDDYTYALVRCGKFDIEDFAIKEDYSRKNCIFVLTELRKNAFKDVFDTDGFVYLLDKSEFSNKNDMDFVTSNSVRIIDKIYIPNVWEELQKYPTRFRFVKYEDCDAYFKEVGVDKEKYLQRRCSRISKIRKKQNGEAF